MPAGPEPRYLGDSVYARTEGSTLVLYLDNGDGEHTRIVMEPEVVKAFDRYRQYVKSCAPNCHGCGKEFTDPGGGVMVGDDRYCWDCHGRGIPYGEDYGIGWESPSTE